MHGANHLVRSLDNRKGYTQTRAQRYGIDEE
jgi:hypothetical protein